MTRFVLASASPARLDTLRRAGTRPEVIVSGVDEDAITAPTTGELVLRLAEAKASAVMRQLPFGEDALVLGCDSLLEFEGHGEGKPGSVGAAAQRWRRMRGKTGLLHTGHCLIDNKTQNAVLSSVSTRVHFADITDDELYDYCHTGEPQEVAGAFAIDGLGSWFIEGVNGDPHNVVGVSLPELRRMLRQLRRSLRDLGWPAAD